MRLVPALLLALLLTVPPAIAQDPVEAQTVVGPVDVAAWVTLSGESDRVGTLRPSEAAEIHATLLSEGNATYLVTLASDGATANATLAPNGTADVVLPVIGPESGPATFVVDVTVDLVNGTNTTRVATGSFELTLAVIAPTPPAPVFPTWAWFVVGAAVLVIGGYGIQRARKRQVRVAPRSRTLQELQVEDKAEKASPKRQAEVEAARAEVEAREAERLAVRENSILDAKRNDILRSIELMKQRHERGELTAFQFQKLKEKKEAQLAELDRQGG